VKRPPCLVPLAAVALALALGAGCTSDDPNGVGAGLPDVALDTTLVPLTIAATSSYGALELTNGDRPLDQCEVLYLGQDDGDASSILATFDFSKLPDDVWTADLLERDNIVSVQLELQMLTWYFRNHGADDPDTLPARFWPGAQKHYDVYEVDAPFDTLSYPGPEPAYNPLSVSDDPELESVNGPIYIDLSADAVAAWIAGRQRVSVVIREGIGSQPGLLGFASKEMAHGGSTLPAERPDISLGPTLIVVTDSIPEGLPDGVTNLVIGPVADVSTWHSVEPTPASIEQGLLFRTHLRSYPALGYDLSFDASGLPPNVRVNRAEIVLVTDTTRTIGPSHVMVASEIRPEFAPPGVTSGLLADLEPEVVVINGRSGLNPEDDASDVIALDVTSSVQRFLNGAYEGPRSFLFTEGESFLTGWRSNPTPDFWFRRRVFYGTGDPDPAHRPRLRIVYSQESEIAKARP
jgi:hypothetical protein